jgi:cobalt-zinc-cadmium efflux system protein
MKNVQPGRALAVALVLTLGYSVVEALAGWWAGSLALLSDAGHMLGDAASLGIAAFAAWAARRAPSPRHSYGFGRAEIVAGLVNAAFMVTVLVWITVAAVQRLLAPQPVRGEAVAAVALVGLLVNVATAWRTPVPTPWGRSRALPAAKRSQRRRDGSRRRSAFPC